MYSAQQDSGTVATPIFGRGGEITYRDWYTTNGFETARIVPDPADSNYLYATGWYGSILRINKITGQTQHIFEKHAEVSRERLAAHGIFAARSADVLSGDAVSAGDARSRDALGDGSPDLTAGRRRRTGAERHHAGAADAAAGRPSARWRFRSKDAKTIWAGTNNGLIQLTRDGGAHWNNVAPARSGAGGLIAAMEASPSDPARAFAVVGAAFGALREARATSRSATHLPHRRLRPELEDRSTRVCPTASRGRCAKIRKIATWFSRRWMPACSSPSTAASSGSRCELNLPAAWCRDLAIEQNDLIVATYGRALWAIDDISPLRELAAKASQVDFLECVSVRARARDSHAVGYLHRYASESRRARRGESARWSDRSIII